MNKLIDLGKGDGGWGLRVRVCRKNGPEELIGNGLLEEIVEDHDVREVDEHGAGLVGAHGFYLGLVIRVSSTS